MTPCNLSESISQWLQLVVSTMPSFAQLSEIGFLIFHLVTYAYPLQSVLSWVIGILVRVVSIPITVSI
jgi:hypothetical protein